MRWIRFSIGLVLLLFSFFFMLGSQSDITGAVTGVLPTSSTTIFSVVVALVSGIICAAGLESRVRVKSSLKEHPGLMKLAEESTRSERVQSEMDHLARQLGAGNFEAGLGAPGHVKGTDVFYLRGRRGARLFYRKAGKDTFELVGKSDKGHEDRVMDRIRKLYQRD